MAEYQSVWRYRAEEIREIARQVRAAAPDVWAGQLREPGDARFPLHVAAACNARLGDREVDVPNYGRLLLRASAVGANWKRGSDVLSTDVLALANPLGCRDTTGTHPGLEVVDIVNQSGTTNAGIAFADVTADPFGVFYTPSGFCRSTAPVVGGPGGIAPHRCKLGVLFFWIMAGLREHQALVDATFDHFDQALKPAYVAGFAQVGGIEFRASDGNRYDPWIRAGAWRRWADHGVMLQRTTDYVADRGAKMFWKLLGGTGEIQSLPQALEFCAHFVRHMAGRWDKVEAVEGANEYEVNQVPLAWLQAMGVELRRLGMPEHVAYSMSSPSLVMGHATKEERAAEVTRMYGPRARRIVPGLLAASPHWDRTNHVPPDMGPDCPELVYAGECRGPDMSSNGDVEDPRELWGDYQAAADAGYTGYAGACDFLVWDHLLPEAFVRDGAGGRCSVITDHPTWAAACVGWRAIADGRRPDPTAPNPGGNEMPPQPYPDDKWWKDVVTPEIQKRYPGRQLDAEAFLWYSRIGHNIGAGLTKEAGLAKALAELDAIVGPTAAAAE